MSGKLDVEHFEVPEDLPELVEHSDGGGGPAYQVRLIIPTSGDRIRFCLDNYFVNYIICLYGFVAYQLISHVHVHLYIRYYM